MALTLLFVLALFVAFWQTIIFVGNALNKTLNTYSSFSIFIYKYFKYRLRALQFIINHSKICHY